jgi:hypothetical protein
MGWKKYRLYAYLWESRRFLIPALEIETQENGVNGKTTLFAQKRVGLGAIFLATDTSCTGYY